MGRHDDALELFERLLSLRNDVGLLAEEYDPRLKRQVGNFPQAFSHIALLSTAFNLSHVQRPETPHPAEQRRRDGDHPAAEHKVPAEDAPRPTPHAPRV